ncbi:hypothetical protein AB0D66_33860 [Streptomyces sp. NPDC048270]|uniref:hypothetical protein n=1 Tax=Streptomyces sp. NPDC048270 TaxID=3154615 RepID=UPI0033C648A2
MNFIRTAIGYAEKAWAAVYRQRSIALSSFIQGTAYQSGAGGIALLTWWLQHRYGG